MPSQRSYVVRSARASLQFTWSMVRGLSAVRRVAIVAGAYAVGTYWVGGSAGYFLAIGAVFGGFFDRGDTSNRVAAGGTFALAGTTVALGSLTALLAGSDAAAVLAVAGCAAASGVASAVSMTAARVLAFTAVLAVANVVAPDDAAAALMATVLVGVGVLAQALGTGLAALAGGDRIERRIVARSLAAVASALRESSAPTATDIRDPRGLVATLSAAETMVDTWDLPPTRAAAYTDVLEAAHDLRVEAIAATRRHRLQRLGAAEAGTLTAAARVLAAAAGALDARAWHRTARLHRLAADLSALPGPGEGSGAPSDRLVLAAARRVGIGAADIAAHHRSQRGSAAVPGSAGGSERTRTAGWRSAVLTDLRRGMRPSTVPGRHGLRLGLATVVSAAVAMAVPDAHSYWIAITAIIVLRPDIPSTLVRTIGRIVGTLAGVAAVVALAALAGDQPMALAAIAMAFALVAYVFQMVNYAAFVFGLVGVIILLTTPPGGDAVAVAGARLADVAVGSLIAVLVSRLVPIWSVSTLPQCLSDYAGRTGDWLAAFGADLRDGRLRPQTNEQLRRRVRAAAHRLRAALATADLEPGDRRVDVELAGAIELAVTQSVRSGLAAVAPMREEPGPHPAAGLAAERASAMLREAAEVLRRTGRVAAAAQVARDPSDDAGGPTVVDDEVRALLDEVEQSARRTLALTRTTLPSGTATG